MTGNRPLTCGRQHVLGLEACLFTYFLRNCFNYYEFLYLILSCKLFHFKYYDANLYLSEGFLAVEVTLKCTADFKNPY